ncbi:thrombospondin type-1 domain-containing protein 7A [Biomphalaria pfeifferi]|uniref:Thrombospondin type-1 domain-containing protein 7A n=1 Tax=Biomphalaria pfeifferi TaxID=112525 RepID=A0AAD8BIJ7_BIOPF|nr:thrombospondin type-1 domain-containing protein 7A [Biomphalaria pfeifferi]
MPSESKQMRHKQNIISGSTNLPRLSHPHKYAVHPISTSPSFASLPDSAVHSAQRSRKNLPLLEKASQDSGHASIPRSRTVSPEEFSLENNDVLNRTGSSTYIKGYSPLHVQTSVESGNECPTPNLLWLIG